MIVGIYSTVYLVLASLLILLILIGVLIEENNLVSTGITILSLLIVWPLFVVILLIYLILRIKTSINQ